MEIRCLFGHAHTQLPPLFELFLRGLTVQPQDDEQYKSSNDAPQSADPGPGSGDCPRPRPLVMRKVPDSDLVSLLNGSQKRSLVVDFEGENAVLIRRGERCAVDSAVISPNGRNERKTVERGEHREFKLERICLRNNEWDVMRPVVQADFNREFL